MAAVIFVDRCGDRFENRGEVNKIHAVAPQFLAACPEEGVGDGNQTAVRALHVECAALLLERERLRPRHVLVGLQEVEVGNALRCSNFIHHLGTALPVTHQILHQCGIIPVCVGESLLPGVFFRGGRRVHQGQLRARNAVTQHPVPPFPQKLRGTAAAEGRGGEHRLRPRLSFFLAVGHGADQGKKMRIGKTVGDVVPAAGERGSDTFRFVGGGWASDLVEAVDVDDGVEVLPECEVIVECHQLLRLLVAPDGCGEDRNPLAGEPGIACKNVSERPRAGTRELLGHGSPEDADDHFILCGRDDEGSLAQNELLPGHGVGIAVFADEAQVRVRHELRHFPFAVTGEGAHIRHAAVLCDLHLLRLRLCEREAVPRERPVPRPRSGLEHAEVDEDQHADTLPRKTLPRSAHDLPRDEAVRMHDERVDARRQPAGKCGFHGCRVHADIFERAADENVGDPLRLRGAR